MFRLFFSLLTILIIKSSSAQVTIYANSVIGFSTEWGISPGNWSAVQALGSPNTFSCGDIVTAWASSTTDSRREFLVLGIPTVFDVNKIEIFETWNPGAIDTVYVRNAISGLWIEVYRTTAIANPICPTSKIINFAPLTYPINAVRIAINSPAVPSWNEIDAVAVSGSSVILPLKLLDFFVRENNNSIDIQWKTDNELEVSHFDLEKSFDGVVFKKELSVISKKISGVCSYKTVDKDAAGGITTYYRLKMVDNNGKFTYSNILKIFKESKISIYPNPISEVINIKGIDKINKIEILDIRGAVVMTRLIKGLSEASIKLNPLLCGQYILRLTSNEKVNSYEIVIL